MAMNTVTTSDNITNLTEVHIGIVGQSLAREGETGKGLRVDLHQRPEKYNNNATFITSQRYNFSRGLVFLPA